MKNVYVNIIIVNYNCCEETIACLNSLLKSTVTNFRVFIVDNNSTDSSVALLLNWGLPHQIKHVKSSEIENQKLPNNITKDNPKFVLVENPENNGFSAGNNIAIYFLLNTTTGDSDYIWLLNPDTVVQPEVLSNLIDKAVNKKKLILGNLIVDYANHNRIMFYGGFSIKQFTHGVVRIVEEKNINKLDAITGASIFTNISTFQDLDVLPQNYFMYWEETDFCTKAKRAGYTFEVNTNSVIYDHVGSSSNSNFLREYLYLLNGLRFYKKYYFAYLPTILISTVAKYFKALFFEDKVKQLAIFYAHIDFFKIIFAKKVDVLQRIQTQNKKLDE